MNGVLTVARNDFRDVRRSRLLLGVVAIYVILMVIVFYPSSEDISVPVTLVGAMWLTTLLLPLVAIVGAYLAIAGERESNTIRFLLSQPTARSAVVVGKFLSRGLALTVALLVALAVGVVLVLTQYGDPDLAALGPFVGLSVLMVSAYVSVSVAISAAVASRARAIATTVGFYFVTVVLSVFPGASIENMLRQVLGDGLGLSVADGTYAFLASALSPAIAYMNALSSTFPADAPRTVPADPPVYLDFIVQAGLVLAWIVVPLALGVIVFGRAEIA